MNHIHSYATNGVLAATSSQEATVSGNTKLLIGLCWSVGGLIFVISLTLALAAREANPVALMLHGAAQRIAVALFVGGWGVLIYDAVLRMRIVHVPVRPNPSGDRPMPNPKAYQLGIMEGKRRAGGGSQN